MTQAEATAARKCSEGTLHSFNHSWDYYDTQLYILVCSTCQTVIGATDDGERDDDWEVGSTIEEVVDLVNVRLTMES
jgi:hypothetical protein